MDQKVCQLNSVMLWFTLGGLAGWQKIDCCIGALSVFMQTLIDFELGVV